MNVGAPDIRGALHLGVCEGDWINSAFNASMMFIGPFSVYLGHSLEGVIALLINASLSASTGLTAMGRAAEVLGLQVRQQAYTLAISDSFLLLATCCVAGLVVVSFMSKVPTQYRQVTAAPVEAK
jgi:DHA2 family multidrug resistance protein